MINAIRQSLMQYETVSKSPVSSPGTPPVYPVQSPVSERNYELDTFLNLVYL
jgi:hypothetical protein